MGTNASYGGSNSRDWTAVRDLWVSLDDADLVPDLDEKDQVDAAPGDASLPEGFDSPSLDVLGAALGDALGRGLRRGARDDIPLSSLLPRTSRGGGGGGAGGAGAGQSSSVGGGGGPRSQRLSQQAARGGAAIGAAVAYRNRDAAALSAYGLTLDGLDAMGPRRRNAAILDMVLGDANHPDESAVRTAAMEQVKVLMGPDGATRTAAEAVREFVGQLVVQLMLVELRNQVMAKMTSNADVIRREKSMRHWVASKVHQLDLARYGTVTSLDCHNAAAKMAEGALRLMRKRT